MIMMYLYLLVAALLAASNSLSPPNKIAEVIKEKIRDRTESIENRESVTLQIDGLGEVIGTVSESTPSSRPIYSFYGLPYGHDTSGDSRFKESSMYETPWNEPLDLQSSKQEYICPQEGIDGSEDCLRLFIHTPKVPGEEGFGDMPVFVWIHGGGFVIGHQESYGADLLLDEDDIVVVSVHYRLGILGFLCTHTDSAPGNIGLADQILALEYVQKYIHNFGGDPSKVVISGQSAGGGSVAHLMLSDRAVGLFNGIIAMAGSSLESWSIDKKPIEHAIVLGAYTGCNYTTDELEDLVECMREKSIPDITVAQELAGDYLFDNNLEISMIPVVEEGNSTRKVISEDPVIRLRTGNFNIIPVIYGTNLHEGSIMFNAFAAYADHNNVINDPDFWRYDSVNTYLKYAGVADDNNGVSEALTEKYFPGVEMNSVDDCKYGGTDLLGAMTFRSGSHFTADCVQRFGGVAYSYSFEFDVLAEVYNITEIEMLPGPVGVAHGFELPFLFPWFRSYEGDSYVLSKKMVKLWTNFIKELNPTPESQQPELEAMGIPMWQPYTADSKAYMKLDKTFEVNEDITQTWTDMMDSNSK